MKSRNIDLNLDAGESLVRLKDGSEKKLYSIVSSINIACGGHAGDEETVKLSLELALEVSRRRPGSIGIGAHPSYPDRSNFGRKSMAIDARKLRDSIRMQTEILEEQVVKMGTALTHLKAHGALYHDLSKRREFAEIFIEIAHEKKIGLIGFAGSPFEKWCSEARVNFAAEGFIDRRYGANGELKSRSESDAIIESAQEAADQGIALALQTGEGGARIDTLCIHGDSPIALASAQLLVARMNEKKLTIEPVFIQRK